MALKHLGFRNLAAVLVLGGAIVGFTSKVALAQPAGPEVGASGRLDIRGHRISANIALNATV